MASPTSFRTILHEMYVFDPLDYLQDFKLVASASVSSDPHLKDNCLLALN